MDYYYILDGHTPVLVDDLVTWGKWFELADRTVAKAHVGDSEVSTVFLGADYSWGDGPPLLFETLVFGGPLADEMERYSTWEQAIAGHEAMVARCRKAEVLA